jgi:hypothetical protein
LKQAVALGGGDTAAGVRQRRGRLDHGAWAIVVVVATTLILRSPGLLEPHHYGDEGIFAAVAQRLLQGHTLYTEAWEDKPPFVYWLYAAVLGAFGPSMLALRTVAALWVAGGAVAVTLLGRRLAGPNAGVAAGMTFAAAASLPMVEANLALTELFAATPVAWAFVLITAESGGRRRRQDVAAGALLAVGFLFKQVVLLDGCAAVVFLLLHGRTGVGRLGPLGAGFAAVTGLTAATLAAQGALGEALFAVFGFYGVYLREGSGLPPEFGAVKLLPAATAVVLTVFACRRRAPSGTDLAALWLGFAATGAALAARPFGHYLVQALAPLALGAALLVRGAARGRVATSLLTSACVASVVLYLAFSGFWLSFAMVRPGYYGAVAAYITGHRSRESLDRFFSWRVDNQQRLASLLRQDDDRTLFVWGEYPWLYILADAENPTRYVTSYHTSFVPGAKAAVVDTLRRHPPRYIVWEREEWRRLPGLAELLAERYERVAVVDNSELYRRKGPVGRDESRPYERCGDRGAIHRTRPAFP